MVGDCGQPLGGIVDWSSVQLVGVPAIFQVGNVTGWQSGLEPCA